MGTGRVTVCGGQVPALGRVVCEEVGLSRVQVGLPCGLPHVAVRCVYAGQIAVYEGRVTTRRGRVVCVCEGRVVYVRGRVSTRRDQVVCVEVGLCE